MQPPPDLTQLLLAARSGREGERGELYDAVYRELRSIASSQRRRHAINSTLHTTALVHESYLRLIDQTQVVARDRLHFFGSAARAMRNILVDHYRARKANKRGGDRQQIPLEPEELVAEARSEMLLDLDVGLRHLALENPRQAQVVELRFFVGLKDVEIGELLEVSDRTVRNDWTAAKAWLSGFLTTEEAGDDEQA